MFFWLCKHLANIFSHSLTTTYVLFTVMENPSLKQIESHINQRKPLVWSGKLQFKPGLVWQFDLAKRSQPFQKNTIIKRDIRHDDVPIPCTMQNSNCQFASFASMYTQTPKLSFNCVNTDSKLYICKGKTSTCTSMWVKHYSNIRK